MLAPALESSTLDPALAPGGEVLGDMVHLAPMMIVALWSLLQLAADAFARPGHRMFQRSLALVGIALALAAGWGQFGRPEYDAGIDVFSGLLIVDQFALLLDIGILLVAGAVILFAGAYCRSHRFEYGEQESLVFIAAFGMMTVIHAADLIALFLGIETMSIAVYVLVGARWNSKQSSEAALKYFLMGAFSSGLLLMGIALLYGAMGTTSMGEIPGALSRIFTQWGAARGAAEAALTAPGEAHPVAIGQAVTGMAPAALLFPGLLFVLCAFLFKMSAAPFHMWTPDVYEGAPTPTTGFMAAGVKIAAIAGFLRLFIADFSTHRLVNLPYGWVVVLWLIAVLTMTIGNFAAVRQSNVKRLLAYSSVAHVGYLLVGLIAAAHLYGDANQSRPVTAENLEWSLTAGDTAIASVLYYVLAYALATMGAFACVAWFGADKLEGSQTHEWAGLAQRHPGMALGLTVCLLALMGMPPTAGFFGKLFVFRAAFEDGNPWVRWLIVIALLNSVVGAYYYLRLIVAMYFREPPARDIGNLPGGGAKVVVAVAAIGSLVMGLFADAFLRPAELAGSGMRLRGQARAAQVERLRTRWKAADADGADAEKVGEDAGADQEGAEAAAQAENEADGQAQDRAPDGGADDGADDGAEG